MRNVSFGQIFILLCICVLLFGDLFSLKKKIIYLVKELKNSLLKKNRKKGS